MRWSHCGLTVWLSSSEPGWLALDKLATTAAGTPQYRTTVNRQIFPNMYSCRTLSSRDLNNKLWETVQNVCNAVFLIAFTSHLRRITVQPRNRMWPHTHDAQWMARFSLAGYRALKRVHAYSLLPLLSCAAPSLYSPPACAAPSIGRVCRWALNVCHRRRCV